MTTAPRLAAPLAALLAASLLTACTDDAPRRNASSDTPAAAPAPSTAASTPAETPGPAPTAPSASPSADAATPVFPANTRDDVAQPSGGPLTVTSVRVARQDGFDRVVFELRGQEQGTPGWRVGYVDEPRQQGSGDLVEVAGEETLQVLIEGVGYPFDTGQEEASSDVTPRDTDRVREVDLQATFEGQFQAFIGLDQRVPFRVTRLADPARVVVDVRHS